MEGPSVKLTLGEGLGGEDVGDDDVEGGGDDVGDGVGLGGEGRRRRTTNDDERRRTATNDDVR